MLRTLSLFILLSLSVRGAVTVITTNGTTIVGLTLTNNPPTPVGWWTFDGQDTTWSSATAGTTADKSGNGNTGTFTSMARLTNCSPGIFGQAFSFSAASDLINCGSATSLDDLTNGFSCSFWYFGVPVTGTQIMITKGGAGYWRVQHTSIRTFSFLKDGTTDLLASYSFQFVTNEWQHFVVTWTGETSTNSVKLYRNGWPQVQTSGTDGVALASDAAQSLTIGGVGGGTTFSETLDNVKVFNVVLTHAQVMQEYNASFTFVGLTNSVPVARNADAIIHWEGTNGQPITAALLTNLTHGAWSNALWTVPASVSNFWISTITQDLFSPATVAGVTYQASSAVLANDRSKVSPEFLKLTLPIDKPIVSYSFMFNCGIALPALGLHDVLYTEADVGNSGVMQWAVTGAQAHTTSDAGSAVGYQIPLNSGVWYCFVCKVVSGEGYYQKVYSTTNWPRPMTIWKQVGYSFSPITNASDRGSLFIGDNAHGELVNGTNYYADIVVAFDTSIYDNGP